MSQPTTSWTQGLLLLACLSAPLPASATELHCSFNVNPLAGDRQAVTFGRIAIMGFGIVYNDNEAPVLRSTIDNMDLVGRAELDKKTGDYIFHFNGLYTPNSDFDYRDSITIRYVTRSPELSVANVNRSSRDHERFVGIPMHGWVAGKDVRHPLTCGHKADYNGAVGLQNGTVGIPNQMCSFSMTYPAIHSPGVVAFLNEGISLYRQGSDCRTLVANTNEGGQTISYQVTLDERCEQPISMNRAIVRMIDEHFVDFTDSTTCRVKGLAYSR